MRLTKEVTYTLKFSEQEATALTSALSHLLNSGPAPLPVPDKEYKALVELSRKLSTEDCNE